MGQVSGGIKRLLGRGGVARAKWLARSPGRGLSALRKRWRRPDVFNWKTAERVGVIYSAPSEMTIAERLFIYTLARGLRPAVALEIGTNHGGSAQIICSAMEDAGRGKLFGIDPFPRITVPEKKFFGRFTLIEAMSPDAIAEAGRQAGAKFNFVLVDGIHIHKQVKLEIAALLPHLAEEAVLLFHDAFHIGVAAAISEAIEAHDTLHDCGYPCARPAVGVGHLAYGGFRMLRFASRQTIDAGKIVSDFCAETGKPLPPTDPAMFDHDPWYCRTYEKCAYCRAKDESR